MNEKMSRVVVVTATLMAVVTLVTMLLRLVISAHVWTHVVGIFCVITLIAYIAKCFSKYRSWADVLCVGIYTLLSFFWLIMIK